jgi:8-oxo-dGTP diphosphatase
VSLTVVAAAVIERGGKVLLAQRPPGKVYAGYWEFPGGKLEPDETPHDALVRELREELGLRVRDASPWLVQRYVYPHAHVERHFFRVRAFDGEPVGHDGQAFAWQDPLASDVAPLLPANTRVLDALRLPSIYGITYATDVGEDVFVARMEHAFAQGLRLVQVREKPWDRARVGEFVARVLPLGRSVGARVLVNADEELARMSGADGVHWTSTQLAAATSRPNDLIVGASCHTAVDVMHASDLDVDFVVLGPVRPTPSHVDASPLGWDGCARAIAGTRVPVFALGGLTSADRDTAIARGAHGIAMRRGAWPRKGRTRGRTPFGV